MAVGSPPFHTTNSGWDQPPFLHLLATVTRTQPMMKPRREPFSSSSLASSHPASAGRPKGEMANAISSPAIPVDIGTFPKPPRNAPDEIVNYDQRVPVENGSFLAWGHLTYTRPLTKRQASDYELRPAPDNPDRPRSIREQMKTAAKQAEADRGQAAPKKNAPDRGDR